ncbi:MAG: ornithine cyclodeaminase [Legionellaceae bacterium]|nr:ornithine cyclodeaminase [Legionellaceae bacterium]
MILLETKAIQTMIKKMGLSAFYLRLCDNLTEDFKNWHRFQKCNRNAMYVDNGVIELMPICNDELYSFKYVNGHPLNPKQNKLNIIAIGMLADVATGYPLMLAAMTVLTAIRTAAASALSSRYLAKATSKKVAIIGCGAQSEFQILAHHALFNLSEVRYFDIDPDAMNRFKHNLQSESFNLVPATSCLAAITDADIIITTTAAVGKHKVLELSWLKPGQHICGIGGDSPGKTELDPEILKHAKVVVEYFPQTHHEGEIQNLGPHAADFVHAEFWEVISGTKSGRTDANEITVFDAVGFALEDFSVLRLCYELSKEFHLGRSVDFVPYSLDDCKDLYGLFVREPNEASSEKCG